MCRTTAANPADMRKRHTLTKSETSEAKKLIAVDGPISTTEQEQVLRYLSDTLESNTFLIYVVTMVHFVLFFLYVALVLSETPLVFFTFDSPQLGLDTDKGASTPSPVAASRTALENRNSLPKAAPADLYAVRIPAAPQRSSGDLLFYTHARAPLSSFAVMGFSALLLLCGGLAGYTAAVFRLPMDIDAIICAHFGNKPRAPASKVAQNNLTGTARDHSGLLWEAHVAVARITAASRSPGPTRVRAMTTARSLLHCAVQVGRTLWILPSEVLSGCHTAHSKCALLSAGCTAFWLIRLWQYHQQRVLRTQVPAMPSASQHGAGGPPLLDTLRWIWSWVQNPHTGLYFGLTDDLLELVLAGWQPLLHVLMASAVASAETHRDGIQVLAALGYRYERA